MKLRTTTTFARSSAFLKRSTCTFAVCLLSQALLGASAGGSEDIPPLHAPHGELPPTFWEQSGGWVIAGAALLLILAGVAIWLLLHRQPPPPPAPDIQARRTLEPLRERAEDGVLLSCVSQVLRKYFATAFELPPDELTTTEFCRAIEDNQRVGAELADPLRGFLRECDERKFAPPAAQPPLRAVPRALELVAQGESRLALARTPAPAAAPRDAAGKS